MDFILIGGTNFLLNHKPILTFDVDLWVGETAQNAIEWAKSVMPEAELKIQSRLKRERDRLIAVGTSCTNQKPDDSPVLV